MDKIKKKDILLTIDYELFLGNKSGSVDNTLIKPTKYFLEKIKEYNDVSVIFFVDACYLYRLRHEKTKIAKDDYQKIKKQLQYIYSRGYQIELHIHAHWLDAHYKNDGTWNLKNTNRYKLSSLARDGEDETIEWCIDTAINELKLIILDIDENYNPTWFRAGGWCIEPFYVIKEYFKKHGVKYDSSVARNMYIDAQTHNVDFRKVPLKGSWNFSTTTLEEDKRGYFKEYPIVSMKSYPIFEKLIRYCDKILNKNKLSKSRFGDGTYIYIPPQKSNIIFKLFNKRVYLLTFENMGHNTMYRVIKKYRKNTEMSNNDKYVFIAHPKGFSPWGIEELMLFLKGLE